MSFKLVAEVLDIKVGNPLRKMVLIKLADQANDDGVCWPSYESIAKTCEISRRSVISHIQWLEEHGFLWIEKRYNAAESKNFSNNYHLTLRNGKQAVKTKCKSRTSAANSLGGANAALGGANDSLSNGENAAPKPISKPTNESINESSSSTPKKPKSASLEKPCDVSDQTWHDLLALRKAKKSPLSVSAWNIAKKQIDEVQAKTGHSLEQILLVWIERGWQGFKAEWYFNHINVQNTQGHQNAINQPTYSPNHQQPVKSDAEIYRDKLMAEYDAFYGTASESAGSQGFSGNVYDLEKPV